MGDSEQAGQGQNEGRESTERVQAQAPTAVTLAEFRRLAELIEPGTAVLMNPKDATMAHRRRCQDMNVEFHEEEYVPRGKMFIIHLREILHGEPS